MHNIMGLIRNGVILLDEPLAAHEGERVIITFIEAYNGAQPDEHVAYIPPTASLAAQLANVLHEPPIDAAAWDAEWAALEAAMNARDLADAQSEGQR